MWRTCSGDVERQPRVQPAEAVLLGGEHRRCARRGSRAGSSPSSSSYSGHSPAALSLAAPRHLRPGLRRLFGVESGRLVQVLVVVEDRRRTVEGEGQHLAVGRGVVAGHRGDIGLRVELGAGVGHHLAHRPRGALAAMKVAVPTSWTCRMCGASPARKAAIPAVMRLGVGPLEAGDDRCRPAAGFEPFGDSPSIRWCWPLIACQSWISVCACAGLDSAKPARMDALRTRNLRFMKTPLRVVDDKPTILTLLDDSRVSVTDDASRATGITRRSAAQRFGEAECCAAVT